MKRENAQIILKAIKFNPHGFIHSDFLFLRKNLRFHLFLVSCLFLIFLSWGVSIFKKPQILCVIGQVEQVAVKVEASREKAGAGREKSIIHDYPSEEGYVAAEEKDGAEVKVVTLVQHLGEPDISISQGAADELAKTGEPVVPELLNKLRASTDVGFRGEVIFLLGRIASKEAVGDILSMLDDDNAYIRRNAAEALGKIKDESATGSLARLLFDEDVSVRERAAWSLGEINSPGAGTSIIEHIREEKEEFVKSAMVEVIGKLKDQSATLALLDELKTQNNQLYKNKIAFSLGELKDPKALQDLNCYLNALKEFKPTEPIMMAQVNEAISIAEEAITKVNTVN